MARALAVPILNEAGVHSSLQCEDTIALSTHSSSEFLLFTDQSIASQLIWNESTALCYGGDQADNASYGLAPLQWPADEMEYLDTSPKSNSWPEDHLRIPSPRKVYSSPSVAFELPDTSEVHIRRSSDSQRHRTSPLPPLSPTISNMTPMTSSTHSDSGLSSLSAIANASPEMSDLWQRLAQDPEYVMTSEEFNLFDCCRAQYSTGDYQQIAQRAVSRYWDHGAPRTSQGRLSFAASFSRQRDWKIPKKQTKPYACDKCIRSFGSRADLRRHTREIHKERKDLESTNRCPEISCERHRKGFARRWNLRDHIRRRHRRDMSLPSNGEREIGNVDAAETSDESASSMESPDGADDMVDESIVGQMEQKSSEQVRHHLHSVLLTLRARRAKTDSQIGKYERMLGELDRQ